MGKKLVIGLLIIAVIIGALVTKSKKAVTNKSKLGESIQTPVAPVQVEKSVVEPMPIPVLPPSEIKKAEVEATKMVEAEYKNLPQVERQAKINERKEEIVSSMKSRANNPPDSEPEIRDYSNLNNSPVKEKAAVMQKDMIKRMNEVRERHRLENANRRD